jgi:multidrug efflux pump
MKLTDLFIKRPVLAIVVNLVILIAGIQAIGTLTVRQYPETQNASITVTTVYVGADADLVRGFITVPLERAIASADGIDYLQSTSARNVSTITARLELNHDATKALAEISSKVDQVRGDLPPEAEVPTINIETADSQFASAYLSFTSDILEQNEITDYLLRAIQPRLSALPGVQKAEILGARNFAMRIWLQPEKMASLNISPVEVRRALAANNYLSAIGQTKGAMIQVNLSANTDLSSVEEFENLVIRASGGALVRLRDVAEVVLGAEDYSAEVRFSGRTATFMGIWVLPDANAIDVIAAVTREMEAIQADLPRGLEARVAYDATNYINNAIDEVIKTLIETLLIVVVVIFLFLGSLRSVLVPVVAIPISLIGAVFIMQVFGFTLNLLTLLAIVLSVGLVVDDAIVMVENVERNLRRGHSPFDAAILGARELVAPVIAMTITLAAVYAPIGLQGGLTGSLFREFAFTLAGAVLISGFVAITLSPWMSSKLLSVDVEEKWLPRHITAGFRRLRSVYGWCLDRTLEARAGVVLVWLVGGLLAVLMYQASPKELAPTEDQGVIFGILNTPANSTLEVTSAAQTAVNEIFFDAPETEFSFQITFPSGGFSGMVLKPWGERERTVFEIKPEVDAALASLPSVEMFGILPGALPGGSNFPVEFVLASTAEPEEILDFARQLQAKAMGSGLFAFLQIDTKIDQPLSRVVLDREKIASMGLDMQSVGADLASLLGGNYVNRFNIQGYSYKVIPQVARVERLNPEQLANIHVTGPDGTLLPLGTIATIARETQPRSLNRMQQLNAVTISGVAIRPLGDALAFLEDEAARILPQGYRIDYLGESRQLRNQGVPFWLTLLLAGVLIYLVLAAQFNSFRDPLVILLGSVPLAMFGATLFSFLKMPNPNMASWTDGWTTTMNIYAQVGLVTLIGLVSKNGILIVEFANQLQKQGQSKLEAVREAARIRLRPVLMTTAATVFGHFPLTLVTGAGAEARNSIGLIIVGGMAIGTFFTLFIVPTIYTLLAKDHGKEDLRLRDSKILDTEAPPARTYEGAGI